MDEVDHVFTHRRPAYSVDKASILKLRIFSLWKGKENLKLGHIVNKYDENPPKKFTAIIIQLDPEEKKFIPLLSQQPAFQRSKLLSNMLWKCSLNFHTGWSPHKMIQCHLECYSLDQPEGEKKKR